jgi:hypothetical protein
MTPAALAAATRTAAAATHAHRRAGRRFARTATADAGPASRVAATSAAVWNRSAGSLAMSLPMTPQSHAGASGMICGIGRGLSSATRLRTASVLPARNGGRPEVTA